MNRNIFTFTILTILGIMPSTTLGLTSYPQSPGFGEPSYSEADMEAAYAEGRRTGHRESSAECLANPKTCGCNDNPAITPCGISLNTFLTGARYGETEPNENIIAADPMVSNAIYWGQSMSHQDQDWFYVTTEEPNQIVNLNFRPANNTGVNWNATDARGWDISVRDAAGNVLAQFPFELESQLNADGSIEEINIPTFVAYPGTYYVVVKTLAIGNPATTENWTPIPYNLISSISFSDSDTPPIDVNFFDVETEPNDDFSTADPLVSTVTMFGMLHTTLAGNATNGWNLQSENDWFWYTSPGNEIATIAWCQREHCTASDAHTWRVTIKMRDGTLISSFDTSNLMSNGTGDELGGNETLDPTPYRTVYLGLEKAGDYFIQVQSVLLLNEDGSIATRCREWSTPQPGGTAVCLSYAPVSTTTTEQYNFTWHGTRRPPNTYDP
jgi:hypothetical protein